MSTVALSAGVTAHSVPYKALKALARLWFVVAVSGQLALAAYVASLYRGAVLQGPLDAWSRVVHGYIQADDAGNLPVVVHLFAVVFLANAVVPLAVLELHLRALTPFRVLNRLAVAAALFALTVAMNIGIFGAAVGMWLPIVRIGRLILSF